LTLSFDLQRSLCALKPQKRRGSLVHRADENLAWISDLPDYGPALLLDTCVYLDVLQGRSPDILDRLLTLRLCYHSSVCLAEMTHLFGRLDPADKRTDDVLQIVAETVDRIPPHRLVAPDIETWGEAGILAGELARRSGAGSNQFLNDALVFLQARRLGAIVLTRNIRDFDGLRQIVPSIPVVFYRI
jgi:predicted nucleic acid-binding protein